MAPSQENSTSTDDDWNPGSNFQGSSDSDTQKSSSSACKKITSKSTYFKSIGKHSDEHRVSNTKKSKSIPNSDNVVHKASNKRLFLGKDEIVLLQAILDYKEHNGADSNLNIFEIHESVKSSLSCTVTKGQIKDKIKGLKRKFVNRVRNGQIAEHRKSKWFELSKKIWPCQVPGQDNKDDNVVMDETEAEAETQVCWSLYPHLCASLVKNSETPMSRKHAEKVVSRLPKEKATELEQEWDDFILMEQKLYAKRAKLIFEQAKAAMKL